MGESDDERTAERRTGGDGTDGAAVTALVGATGGAGTTRLSLEAGALLARTGERVAVFDAALDTQGLADHVPGRVGADVVELVTGDADPADALVELDADGVTGGEGTVHVAPVRAPFDGVARAKTETAARRLETTLREAADRFDRVLVDTPPVGSNPAVAAVTAADRVGVVTPATGRGLDAVQRVRGRIEDVGGDVDAVVGNRAPPGVPVETGFDAVVPESEVTAPGAVPVAGGGDGAFSAGVADAVAATVGVELAVEFETGGYLDRLP